MAGTLEKALKTNLDPRIYGTLAEIGAGQEVARNLFLAGAASGTIAKTMSAYDMQFSDAIYGAEPDGRYVCYSRVNKMLDCEYKLVLERLENHRPENTTFFSFADTVTTKSQKNQRDGHGWMGIKFQTDPLSEPNKIILHIRLHENSNVQQQQILGVLGINLIYAAYFLSQQPTQCIDTLLENIAEGSIEIDMIEFLGPVFKKTDNRLMALHLVKSGLTRSVFFTRHGKPIQGADLLYRKNILVLRGSYRPFTLVHENMIACAKQAFMQRNGFGEDEIVVLPELSMSHLLAFGTLDIDDFLGRVDTLNAMGMAVQISDFANFHSLKVHLAQFSTERISLAIGIKNVSEIFSEQNYTELAGGMVEGLGKLFSNGSNLYVYPKQLKTGEIRELDQMVFDDQVEHLFQYFFTTNRLIALKQYNPKLINIYTHDLRAAMSSGDPSWQEKIPAPVAEIILSKKLFGIRKTQ